MFEALRTKIKTILESINNSPIQEIKQAESSFFSGYPAVSIVPSSSEADYHETNATSNKRRYVFSLKVYYPFNEGQETADLEIGKVVDVLLDTFRDKSIISPTADWVVPVPSVWGYSPRADGLHRTAEIKLTIIKYL